ncbi:serine hydrolase domain-containing protein [Marinifilum fragile]
MEKIKIILTVILSIIFIDNLQSQNSKVFPDSTWLKHDTIENVGYDSKKFNEINRFIIDSLNTTGLVVIVDGKILFDYGDIDELSYIASCRKSILSMIYGKYVENNTINLDETLEELEFDDIQGLLPIEKKATVRNLITARSGIYHPASNEGSDNKNNPGRGSMKPGTYFLYNNWDFNAAGAIFEQQTGLNIYDAFKKDIAIPIQMQDFEREKQEKSGNQRKSKYLAYHFWFSTRDMARLGLLMLNMGNWDGEQIIPKDWIKLITSVTTSTDEMNSYWCKEGNYAYGYMWWIWEKYNNPDLEGAYLATGAYGQYILVIPKLNMVIAHKTKSDYKRNTDKDSFEKLVYKILDLKMK